MRRLSSSTHTAASTVIVVGSATFSAFLVHPFSTTAEAGAGAGWPRTSFHYSSLRFSSNNNTWSGKRSPLDDMDVETLRALKLEEERGNYTRKEDTARGWLKTELQHSRIKYWLPAVLIFVAIWIFSEWYIAHESDKNASHPFLGMALLISGCYFCMMMC